MRAPRRKEIEVTVYRKLVALGPLVVLGLVGCGNDYPVRRVEAPVNVTHEVAFGDYRRVFNTTYHIVNRYGVVQRSSYRYGEITALISEDTQLFDKTRKEILARIFDKGDYYEVECHVLIKVEDGEVATFEDQFQPEYSWKTVARDSRLEVRLNNEIRAALSGGAWEAKQPLTPKPIRPAVDPAPRVPREPGGGDGDAAGGETDEVRLAPRSGAGSGEVSAQAFERLGIESHRDGDFERAEAAFRTSLRGDADNPFARYLLAQALFSQGRYEAALESVESGLGRNPDWLRADIDVRELYPAGSDTFGVRLAELEAAARDDEALELLVGYMRFYSGDAEGALTAFERYLEDHDDPSGRAFRDHTVRLLEQEAGLEEF